MPGKALSKPRRYLSKTNLRIAWDNSVRSGKNYSTPGIDRQRGRDFAKNLDSNLTNIARDVADGTYRFQKLKCCWVPKRGESNKERLICIPTVRDRLVQRAVVEALEEKDKLRLSNKVSFGFQKGLGVKNAIARAIQLRSNRRWYVKTDISSFFDKIHREKLIEKFERRGPRSLVPLITQMIACEVKAEGDSDESKMEAQGIVVGRGIRQGMPISPLLSNLELSSFDRKVVRANMHMVRYADDLIFFCATKDETLKTLHQVKLWLKEVGHDIPDLQPGSKTNWGSPNESVEFLGLDIWFDKEVEKYAARIPEKSISRIVQETRANATLDFCKKEKLDLVKFIMNLNSRGSSYYSVYKNASNLDDFKHRFEHARRDALQRLLTELLGEETLKRLSKDNFKWAFFGLQNILSQQDEPN